jgi:hypothetical protein
MIAVGAAVIVAVAKKRNKAKSNEELYLSVAMDQYCIDIIFFTGHALICSGDIHIFSLVIRTVVHIISPNLFVSSRWEDSYLVNWMLLGEDMSSTKQGI